MPGVSVLTSEPNTKTGDWLFGAVARDVTSTFNAWSFSLSDDEKEVFVTTGNDIPKSSIEVTRPKLILGAARKFAFKKDYNLLASLDLDFTTDGQRNVLVSSKAFNMDPHLGLELEYKKFLYLRGGIGNFQKAKDDINGDSEILTLQPNFGVGLKFGRLNIDYALTDIGNVAQVLYSHIFSLRLDLKPKN